MTKLGESPYMVEKMRKAISAKLKRRGYKLIDAGSEVTGGNMLEKIWNLLENTPVAIAVCCKGMRSGTLANIFYELGVAQAMGSETLIVKTRDFKVPSDLAGIEYVVFDEKFNENFGKYMDHLADRAKFYEELGAQLRNERGLALDYYRRAYLLAGDDGLRKKFLGSLRSSHALTLFPNLAA